VLVLQLGGVACGRPEQVTGPKEKELPALVIYDNDDVVDVYTDEYLMALASAGDIRLAGMITSSSVAPFNPWVPARDYERMVENREEGVRRALRSGLRSIPTPVRGPAEHLARPASGQIEDTQALGSEGGRLIVEEARTLGAGEALVVVMGGPLTAAADAYLQDPSIADKVVIAWLGGTRGDMGDYNGRADPWAAYIVLRRLRLVQFPAHEAGNEAAPRVPKDRLRELPPGEMRDWMISKEHPNGLPAGRDADSPPAIWLMRPDYVVKAERVSFGGWVERGGRNVPAFRDDPGGRTVVVTRADRQVATEEWWRALTNPAAYGRGE
jgi:hypothetical protein